MSFWRLVDRMRHHFIKHHSRKPNLFPKQYCANLFCCSKTWTYYRNWFRLFSNSSKSLMPLVNINEQEWINKSLYCRQLNSVEMEITPWVKYMWRRDDSRDHSGHCLHSKPHQNSLEEEETKIFCNSISNRNRRWTNNRERSNQEDYDSKNHEPCKTKWKSR